MGRAAQPIKKKHNFKRNVKVDRKRNTNALMAPSYARRLAYKAGAKRIRRDVKYAIEVVGKHFLDELSGRICEILDMRKKTVCRPPDITYVLNQMNYPHTEVDWNLNAEYNNLTPTPLLR